MNLGVVMSRQFRFLYVVAFVSFVMGVGLLGYSWFTQSSPTEIVTQPIEGDRLATPVNTPVTEQLEGGAEFSASPVEVANIVVPSGVGATPTPLPTITPEGMVVETADSSDGDEATTETADVTAAEEVVVVDSSAPAQPTAPATSTPLPTDVAPEPTVAPTAEPATPEPVLTGPSWLQYLNLFRSQGGVEVVVENERWSGNSASHSRYMVANTTATHGENEGAGSYTNGGRAAGINGNIAIAGWAAAPEVWSIDFWMSAPFHAVPLLDPHLHSVGYGIYTDPNTSFQQGGTMQYKTGLADHLPEGTVYPLMFPRDGGQTWVLSHRNPEFPNPLDSCPGYQHPTGPPIMIQLGAGSITPAVSSSKVLRNGSEEVPHCVIHEDNYVSSNTGLQRSGRVILNTRDAVVLMPAAPFQVGESYTVELVSNGQSYSWSFDVVHPPTPDSYGAGG